MPITVDPKARRSDIVDAALILLSEGGPRALTVRALGRLLGGSTALVTHFYATREDLLKDFATQMVSRWKEELADLEAFTDSPTERLKNLILWMLPTSEKGRTEERAGLSLITAPQPDRDIISDLFTQFDTLMRGLLRDHLACFVPAAQLEDAVDVTRIATLGVVVAASERPEAWPASRQFGSVAKALRLLGIDLDASLAIDPETPIDRAHLPSSLGGET